MTTGEIVIPIPLSRKESIVASDRDSSIRRGGLWDDKWRIGRDDKENFKNENIFKTLQSLTVEELEAIKDIGPVSARSIVYFIEDKSELIKNLFAELNIEIEIKNKAQA